MLRLISLTTIVFAALSATGTPTYGDVRPNALFTDGMVLQQRRDVQVWGTADGGEKITVSFRGQEVSTVADSGRWAVKLNSGSGRRAHSR